MKCELPKSLSDEQRRVARILNRFERAIVAHSWRGGARPEDVPDIVQEYKDARREAWKLRAIP